VLACVCLCVCEYVFVCVLLLFFADCSIHLFSSLAARVFNKLTRYRCQCMANWYGQRCTEAHDDCSSASSIELCVHGTCHNVPRSQPGQVDLHTSQCFRRRSFYLDCIAVPQAQVFQAVQRTWTSNVQGRPTSRDLCPYSIVAAVVSGLSSTCCGLGRLLRFEPNLAKSCHA